MLQTRLQKMPYKHIAAHLKKTELACRLHFHQLSHGSHRRKRTLSISSSTSSSSAGHSTYSIPGERDDFSRSRHASPLSYHGGSPHVRASSMGASPNRSQHKVLLPKPSPLTPRDSPEPYHPLRINTEVAHQPKVVDTERLRAIYEGRRQQFWAAVAADYGANVSPAQLEEIWRSGSGTVRPPTPDQSPDGSVVLNPILKSTPYQYSSPSYSEPAKYYSAQTVSSVSAPDRIPYILPVPVPTVSRQRSSTWSSAPRDNVPISSLID